MMFLLEVYADYRVDVCGFVGRCLSCGKPEPQMVDVRGLEAYTFKCSMYHFLVCVFYEVYMYINIHIQKLDALY